MGSVPITRSNSLPLERRRQPTWDHVGLIIGRNWPGWGPSVWASKSRPTQSADSRASGSWSASRVSGVLPERVPWLGPRAMVRTGQSPCC